MNEGADALSVDPYLFAKWILFEDENLLVLNKPGWLVCHPSKNGPWSSLVGAAKEYIGVDSLHLVSRLDRETSGVVMIAKHKKSASFWQKGVEARMVGRIYLAIVRGEIRQENKVKTFLGNATDSKVFVKQAVAKESRKSKAALTRFLPVKFADEHTLCLVQTETGRKHQIRVHAQHIGHSIVGDKLYGEDEAFYLSFCEGGWNNKWYDTLGMNRQALHGLLMNHKNEDQEFIAPLPKDMMEFLNKRLGWDKYEIKDLVVKFLNKLGCTVSLEQLSNTSNE